MSDFHSQKTTKTSINPTYSMRGIENGSTLILHKSTPFQTLPTYTIDKVYTATIKSTQRNNYSHLSTDIFSKQELSSTLLISTTFSYNSAATQQHNIQSSSIISFTTSQTTVASKNNRQVLTIMLPILLLGIIAIITTTAIFVYFKK